MSFRCFLRKSRKSLLLIIRHLDISGIIEEGHTKKNLMHKSRQTIRLYTQCVYFVFVTVVSCLLKVFTAGFIYYRYYINANC